MFVGPFASIALHASILSTDRLILQFPNLSFSHTQPLRLSPSSHAEIFRRSCKRIPADWPCSSAPARFAMMLARINVTVASVCVCVSQMPRPKLDATTKMIVAWADKGGPAIHAVVRAPHHTLCATSSGCFCFALQPVTKAKGMTTTEQVYFAAGSCIVGQTPLQARCDVVSFPRLRIKTVLLHCWWRAYKVYGCHMK